MPYVTTEQIELAKQMDLLTYLQTYEPQELVHVSGNVYSTRTHDSLKISNGKWCWWSRGIGGRSALDYLIHVCNKTLPDAVLQLNGMAVLPPPCRPDSFSRPVEPKKLLLPEKNATNDRVIAYLSGRGIDRRLIDYCIKTGRLYESRQLFENGIHYNAVFLGFGPDGNPKYAAIRGTENLRFMVEANGSDKHYSFAIPARSGSPKLHLFESAIDLLSYPDVVSIEQMCQMLGGIGKKTGYRLLKEKKIEAFKIGKSYKIPKIQIISYLKVIGDPVIINPTLTPQT